MVAFWWESYIIQKINTTNANCYHQFNYDQVLVETQRLQHICGLLAVAQNVFIV